MAANRLIKFLKENKWGGQDGIDLYNHTYFDEIHPAITTRSINSNNYFIMEECIVVGTIDSVGYDMESRVYDVNGIAPTQRAYTGGGQETKILVKEHNG